MNLIEILLVFVSGLITSNCVVGTASGVDLALNGFQSKKHTMIYFTIISCVTILSALSSWVLSLALNALGIGQFLLFGSLLIVSMYAQIAEYVCSKIAPMFLKNSYGLLATLTFTAYIILATNYFMQYTFVIGLFKVLAECLGIGLILFIVSGIRQSRKYYDLQKELKGNVLNLVILLVLFVAMYAIV